jgi:hypothetical protein
MALTLEQINRYFYENQKFASCQESSISQFQGWPSDIQEHEALKLIQRDGRVCFSFNWGSFCGMDLSGVNFRDVDLQRASFNRAIMRNADLTGALLGDAVLVGTDLRDALGLTPNDGYHQTYLGEGIMIGQFLESATRLPDSLLKDWSLLVPTKEEERTDNPLSNVEAWFRERKREANSRYATLIDITPPEWQPDCLGRKPLTIYTRPDDFKRFCEELILDIQSLKEREAERKNNPTGVVIDEFRAVLDAEGGNQQS